MDKVSYALGMNIAQNLISSGLKKIDAASFQDGLNAVLEGIAPAISVQDANQVLQDHFSNLESQKSESARKDGEAFLIKNAQRKGVISLESGLQYEVINNGKGSKPIASNKVRCHYHGTLIDGTVFDSSVERGEPAVFPVNGVIAGWVEALQLMNVGDKWRLYIPPHLAYGPNGAGGVIGPDTTLVFDVELLGI